jgi:hypothetical protein
VNYALAAMIGKNEMFEPMLLACSIFVPAFLNEWDDSKEELPYYVALGDLARHLVEQIDAGATENFEAVFNVVDRWRWWDKFSHFWNGESRLSRTIECPSLAHRVISMRCIIWSLSGA